MKKTFLFIFLAFTFSWLSGQQKPRYSTGLLFDDEAYEKIPLKAPLVRSLYGKSLPLSASLKKYSPTPSSQGTYGTCVGWSTAYAARTIIEAINNKWTDKTKITENAFSPGFIYKITKSENDYNCSNGTYIDQALQNMKEKGVPKYSYSMLSCPDNISNDVYQKAANYKIQDFAKIYGLTDENSFKIEATKKSLSEKKPVVIGMNSPSSFQHTSGCWTPTENANISYGGHAMCVIGYDDNQYGGAFEIQNSWGSNWGNNGYIWVKYEDYANFSKYAYELIYIPKIEEYINLSGEIVYRKPHQPEVTIQ